MTAFFATLFTTSVLMSLVILFVIGLTMLFPAFFSGKIRVMLWVIVLVGLLIPFRPVLGGGLVKISPPESLGVQGEAIKESIVQGIPAIQRQTAGLSSSVSPMIVVVVVWAAVAILSFAWQLLRYFRFKRMIKRWGIPIDSPGIWEIFSMEKGKCGVRAKNIRLISCNFISTSMVTGFLHPVVLLPNRDFDDDELELIFAHELTHLKQHHLLLKLLACFVTALHWFNPFVYLMSSAMQADVETACDETVLKNANITDRQFYGEVIIGMIGKKSDKRTSLSTCFYAGKLNIKRRLAAIMNTQRKRKQFATATLCVVSVMTLLSGSIVSFASKSVDSSVRGVSTISQSGEYDIYAALSLTSENYPGAVIKVIYSTYYTSYEIETVNGQQGTGLEIDANSGQMWESYTSYFDDSHMHLVQYSAAQAISIAEKGYPGQVFKLILHAHSSDVHYELDMAINSRRIGLRVDAQNGKLTKEYDSQQEESSRAGEISEDRAGKLALSRTGGQAEGKPPSPVDNTPTSAPGMMITSDRAAAIALEKTGGGKVDKCKYEEDEGVYEVKVENGDLKYEMTIDANTGTILDFEED